MSLIDEFKRIVGPIVKANPKGRPIDKDGKFYGNPISLEPPLGYNKQPSLMEQVRNMVRSEQLRQAAEEQGFESFEEGDDFDVDDDYDPRSPFEYDFDPPVPVTEGAAARSAAAPASQPGSDAGRVDAAKVEPGQLVEEKPVK